MRFAHRLVFVLAASASILALPAQPAAPETAEQAIKRIYDSALTESPAYEQLRELTTVYGGRLAGSKQLEGAVLWGEKILNGMGLDRVWKQEVKVPHWERGAPESVVITGVNGADLPLAALALGGSAPTPPEGITAEVIEVKSLGELEQLGREKIQGKIVFFNGPMEPRHVLPGRAYGEAGAQRGRGPVTAASYGAVGALTRSLTHALDDIPHTGNSAYKPEGPNAPAAALSTIAANRLSAHLAANPGAKVRLVINSKWFEDAPSHNVIGELRGSEFPDEVMVVGGHLDSWDIAPGAHDDGSGIVQSIEVLRLFKQLGIRPRHTLRVVLFTNEENGLRGGTAYAAAAREAGEKHVFAVESDGGGFQARGFSIGSTQFDAVARAEKWKPLLAPYGVDRFVPGRGGADIGPLMHLGATVADLTPDSQRYFDIHHTREDSIDKVNKRELEQGAAAVAALVHLFDTQGL